VLDEVGLFHTVFDEERVANDMEGKVVVNMSQVGAVNSKLTESSMRNAVG
jgi:hypothetical protein